MKAVRRHARGFSLLELAVALFILTILLTGMLMPLNSAALLRAEAETKKRMVEINDALIGHLASHGHLPCPDKTTAAGFGFANDGREDESGGTCVTNTGNIPWATLGVGAMDAWFNRFRYTVMPAYAARSPTSIGFGTAATIVIGKYANAPNADLLVLPYDPGDPSTFGNQNNRAVAVIVSHGPNGLGAINANTGTPNPAPTSADELANLGSTGFVSRVPSPAGAGAGEFDDLVHWIGRPLVFNTLIKVNLLP